MLPVRAAVDGDRPAGGGGQSDDHAHRRRLAGAVRAEEAGDDTGPDRESEVADRDLRSVCLGQSACFDHVTKAAGPAARRQWGGQPAGGVVIRTPTVLATRTRGSPGPAIPSARAHSGTRRATDEEMAARRFDRDGDGAGRDDL